MPETKHTPDRRQAVPKLRKSFRLTHEAAAILRREAERAGISDTAVLEQAIRAYSRGRR